VDDVAVLGIDDREEVRFLDAGSGAQAGEVEELLRGGACIASRGEAWNDSGLWC
jgi:hypothetical protein